MFQYIIFTYYATELHPIQNIDHHFQDSGPQSAQDREKFFATIFAAKEREKEREEELKKKKGK